MWPGSMFAGGGNADIVQASNTEDTLPTKVKQKFRQPKNSMRGQRYQGVHKKTLVLITGLALIYAGFSKAVV